MQASDSLNNFYFFITLAEVGLVEKLAFSQLCHQRPCFLITFMAIPVLKINHLSGAVIDSSLV